MLRRTLIFDRRGRVLIGGPAGAWPSFREPLIDRSCWNIYPGETFGKHLDAWLAGDVVCFVGRPSRLMAPDALAALPNDAR
jgi:hypothetical protein